MTVDQPRCVLLAMPVMARSGVYRSTHDLVRAAREAGLEWSAVIGVRSSAKGVPATTEGVREIVIDGRGRQGVAEIRDALSQAAEVAEADVVISLISQTDVAVAGARDSLGHEKTWIAWVRGMPWPAPGEQGWLRSQLLRRVETAALRKADDVWATTPVLASQFSSAREAFIVPAGIPPMKRISRGENATGPVVWAGRVDVDKRPELFIAMMQDVQAEGRLYGDGPLAADLASRSPGNVEWAGWADPGGMWTDASVFVGTSEREAFGRSAVEAAGAGLPVVIAAEYGAAPLLFTDPALAEVCVIESADPAVWARSVTALLADHDLRARVSDHVHGNASRLTISASVQAASARAQKVRSITR